MEEITALENETAKNIAELFQTSLVLSKELAKKPDMTELEKKFVTVVARASLSLFLHSLTSNLTNGGK